MPARFLSHWWSVLLWPPSLFSFRVPVERKGEATKNQLVPETLQSLRQMFGLGQMSWASGALRRAPQYTLDLFNAVANANGVSKSPGHLEGNVVRSSEHKESQIVALSAVGRYKGRRWKRRQRTMDEERASYSSIAE